jgi:hypothetical protein
VRTFWHRHAIGGRIRADVPHQHPCGELSGGWEISHVERPRVLLVRVVLRQVHYTSPEHPWTLGPGSSRAEVRVATGEKQSAQAVATDGHHALSPAIPPEGRGVAVSGPCAMTIEASG